jgi:hypothetical protein
MPNPTNVTMRRTATLKTTEQNPVQTLLSFDDTIFDSPIRDARICSLLETEGEATGVSVLAGIGEETGPRSAWYY